MKALSPSTFIIILLCTVLISACNRDDDEASSESIKVSGPANEILQKEGSLHIFSVQKFEQASDSRDDIMLLTIDSFSPSVTNIEPEDEDDDQTLNRLKYKQLSWEELNLAWATIENPLQDSKYMKPRSYRVLEDGFLQAAKTILNRPIYETIDDNIFERQLAARFVWDFSRYGDVRAERDVFGDRLDDYENLYNYPVLPHVDIWADIEFDTVRFSDGALIYAASRSVALDTVVVESVFNNNGYTLSPTRIAAGMTNLNDALNSFPIGGNRLAYQFTVDYDQHHTLHISFDLANAKAQLFNTASGSQIAEADLIIDSTKPYAEIDTMALDSSLRATLNLPSYFNPVIIGPFEGAFFYGKRYIKTDAINRLLLQPVFFLNNPAKNDVENTFKRWRVQVENDR